MLNLAYNSHSKMEIPIQERRKRWVWNMQSSSSVYLVVALLATNWVGKKASKQQSNTWWTKDY